MLPRRELIGVAAAAASSLLGGMSVVATRFVIAETDAVTLGMLRFGIGAACLLPLVLASRRARLARRDVAPVLLLGVLFFAVFPWLFNLSLSFTTAARGSLALSTLPLLTLAVAAAFGVERLTRLKLAGVLVALLGVWLALSSRVGFAASPDGAWRGDLFMVAAALCGAFYNVLSRPFLRRYPSLAYTGYGMCAGAVVLAAADAAGGAPLAALAISPMGWVAVLFLGICGAALTFFLWSYGLEHATPTRVAITVTLNPIASMALGSIVLDEPTGHGLLVGLGAVAAGIVLANWPTRRPVAVDTTAPKLS
jgi:drug/metabolite transporter (DMT)-like permease